MMDVQILRDSAAEIAREGHNGWGNACADAADEIERLRSKLAEAERERDELDALCKNLAGTAENHLKRAERLERERDTAMTDRYDELHDARARADRLEAALRFAERHCPCGARVESPYTHPHVAGCIVAAALEGT